MPDQLHLYFGLFDRQDPDEAKCRNKSFGPVFGPYRFVHAGAHAIHLIRPDGATEHFCVMSGQVFYAGKHYSHWGVFAGSGTSSPLCLQAFDPSLAAPARPLNQEARTEIDEEMDYRTGEQTVNFCPLCEALADVEVTVVTPLEISFRCDAGHEFREHH